MKSHFELIEEAIISAIKAELLQADNPATGYLAAVMEYGGEFDDEDGLDDIKARTLGKFPAVLVSAEGGDFRTMDTTRKNFEIACVVNIYIVSNNVRSRERRARNGPVGSRDPGLYQCSSDIHQLVGGTEFGLDGVDPSVPISSRSIFRHKQIAAWQMTYEFVVDANVKPWDAGNGQVLASYYLKSQIAEHPVDDPPNPVVESEGQFD